MKPHNFLENVEFAGIIRQTLTQILLLLLKNDTPFAILTDISRVSFDPKLPSSITQKFQPITLFILENYTFSSAKLADNCLVFEAGFGENNFASLVSVPLGAILQIAVGNTPIFLNVSVDKTKSKPKLTSEDRSRESLEALLNNPKNQKLTKKINPS
jgi:hypothetical protein